MNVLYILLLTSPQYYQWSDLNKLEGVAANRFLSSGDHAVSVTPPPALYKGVAASWATSHTFNIYTEEITVQYQL